MAKLSPEDVLKLAQLSRLHLTKEEVSRFQAEIETILDYVEQLQGVKLEGLEPTSQVTGLTNIMRSDEVKDYGYEIKTLLSNVPHLQDGQIKVNRMIQ